MRPERRLLVLLAAGIVPAAWAVAWKPVEPYALAALAVSVLVATADALAARRLTAPRVRRVVPRALALGVWSTVNVELENVSRRVVDAEVWDHHPPHGDVRGLPRRVVTVAEQTSVLEYRFRPRRRGAARFELVELLVRSPLGLWRSRRRLFESTSVKIFPDFRSVQRFAILGAENARGPLGIRRRQQRGDGLELHQLREYREGDALRQIDWKATSRRDRVISRQYESERNQQIVFLLDCGWRMRAVDDDETHFDRALNSLLLLTYIAVRQGDAAGLFTLAGIDRWLPPQRGPQAVTRMLEAVYDLEPTRHHPDFVRAATALTARQRRRALVVVVSNLRDEDDEEAATMARLLRRRHLVLFASLRESSLDAAVDAPIEDFRTALRTAATHHFWLQRQRAHDLLRVRGVTTLDVTPAELPAALVNRYFDIKRSGAL